MEELPVAVFSADEDLVVHVLVGVNHVVGGSTEVVEDGRVHGNPLVESIGA